MRFWRRNVGAMVLGLAALGLPSPGFAVDRRDPRLRRWRCLYESCLPYVYDPLKGDPTAGIRPGTPFEELPDEWLCPECGRSRKVDFRPID